MSTPIRLGWRIASTEAGLARGNFKVRNIPPPDSAPYRGYSHRVSKTTGGQARHGYKNVRFFWEVLDRGQAAALKRVIQAGLDDAGLLFLTIDRNDGDAGGIDWIDVSGRPYMPDFDPSTPIASASRTAHERIELFVNNLTIVNDPASF